MNVDLSSIEFWALSPAEREQRFAQLRAAAPVTWQRQPESQLLPESEGTGGYWAIVRYDDVREVSRDPERFCSARGGLFEDVPAELLEASQAFLASDGPRHAARGGDGVDDDHDPDRVPHVRRAARASRRRPHHRPGPGGGGW